MRALRVVGVRGTLFRAILVQDIAFFDGFRTSHELAKIAYLEDDDLRAMMDEHLVELGQREHLLRRARRAAAHRARLRPRMSGGLDLKQDLDREI